MRNNYAYEGMLVNGSVVPGGDPNIGHDKPHGASITSDVALSGAAFWYAAAPSGPAFDAAVWDVAEGRLPLLKPKAAVVDDPDPTVLPKTNDTLPLIPLVLIIGLSTLLVAVALKKRAVFL